VKRFAALAALATGILVWTPVALAQQPTSGLGEGGGVQGAVGGGGDGALPFTGLDLVFLIVGALALLVVGLGLRRLGRASR